jgi:hypothetical protein
MSNLNLLPKKQEDNLKFVGLRRKVYAITSIFLIGNLIVLSGFLGWWVFLSTKKRVTAGQIDKLKTQVNALAQAEVLARQLDSRANQVKQVLAGRDKVPQYTQDIQDLAIDVGINNWKYTGKDGANVINIVSESSSSIENFAESLAEKYTVVIDKMSKDKDGVWTAILSIHAHKS